jgi:hypothetical protein
MPDNRIVADDREEIADLKAEVAILKEEVEVLEEIIDLEEQAKAGKEPKKAKKYRIRIDKKHYVVDVHQMTGRQILAVAGLTPEKYVLSQKLHGGVIEPVGPDEIVVFHVHKVERFQTVARDCTEG